MTFFKKHQSKTFKNLYRHSRWLKWLEKSHCTLHLQLYSWKKSLGNICRLWFITESMFIDQKSPVLLCFIFNYVYGWFKYTGGKKWSCVYLAPYCEKLRIFERREACHAEQRALTFEISHRREETGERSTVGLFEAHVSHRRLIPDSTQKEVSLSWVIEKCRRYVVRESLVSVILSGLVS